MCRGQRLPPGIHFFVKSWEYLHEFKEKDLQISILREIGKNVYYICRI